MSWLRSYIYLSILGNKEVHNAKLKLECQDSNT